MLEQAQLAAYFARIGYQGPHQPSLAALREIVFRHATAIPFENIDPLLGRGVSLDPAALIEKLVERGRGGYCFEHNGLLRDALSALGFAVTGLAARVVWNRPAALGPGPRTHMLLRVSLPEGPYLADVGFGGLTLTAPIPLIPSREQQTPHEPHRLMPDGDGLVLQARLSGEWTPLYRFSFEPQLPIDYEVASWFTATVPNTLFTANLLMARPEPDRRYALLNREFTIRRLDGAVERRTLGSADEFGEVLSACFRLDLPRGDVAAVWQRIGA